MKTLNLPAVMERFRTEISTELKSVLAGRQSPLYDMLRYHMGWVDPNGREKEETKGKALRPTFCLLACEAVGGDYHRALPAAAAIELLHNYSLIHDDVQDDDRERHHRPTVWAIWGKPQAINAGTAMRILTNTALSRLGELGVSPEKRLLVQNLLDEASLRLLEGQYLDISFEKRLDITVNDYLQMIEGKTASLIACALEIGALLGTEDELLINSFRSLGMNLGLGFQIRDDILGIWGDTEVTGKPLGSDILRKKKTLPVVHAVENAYDGYKEKLVRFYEDSSGNQEVGEILAILKRVGAQSYAENMSDSYCREAWRILNSMSIEPFTRHDFEDLLDFLQDRNY